MASIDQPILTRIGLLGAAAGAGLLAGWVTAPDRERPTAASTEAGAPAVPAVTAGTTHPVLPVFSHPAHGTLGSALAEPDPFQKVLSLAAVVSVTEVPALRRYWEQALASGDALAQEVVLDAWRRRDLDSFAAVVPSLETRHLRAVLEPFVETDQPLPEALYDAVAQVRLSSRENRTELLKTLYKLDETLFHEVVERSGLIARVDAQSVVEDDRLRRLETGDPRGVLDPASEFSTHERARVLANLAREDLVGALEIAASAPSPRDRAEFQAALVPVWAAEDHAAAMAWAAENLEGRLRVEALAGAIRDGSWVKDHPAEALSYAALIPSRDSRIAAVDRVFLEWGHEIAQGRPEELGAFVEAIRSFPIDDLPLNGDLGFAWPNADLASAAAFLEEAPPDIDLGRFTEYVAQRFAYEKYGRDLAGGVAWASRLTLERGKDAVGTILNRTSPDDLAAAIDQLPDGEFKDFATVRAAWNWAGDHPEQTADWVLGRGNPEAVEAVRETITASPLEPDVKRSLLERLSRGGGRDR